MIDFLVYDKLLIFGLLIFSFLIGFIFNQGVNKIYLVIAKKIPLHNEIKKYFYFPSWFLISILIFSIASSAINFKLENSDYIITKTIQILYVLFFGILSIRTISFLEYILNEKQPKDIADFHKRQLNTQLKIIKSITTAIISVICMALIFLSFSSLKSLGSTILTSAGIIGIIAGFAAQKTLNLLFAGIQIAISQPIKIGDVLIVEGEWGTVEEITLTYVVLKIWDLRRLVIPINYFVEKSFQNWTKTSTQLLGTVYIYLDYSIDIEKLRKALNDILNSTPLWDKFASGIQVTDANDKTMQVRALVSAKNSSDLWNLRCLVREKLIEYIKNKAPQSLPKIRNIVYLEEK
ncbi:MAG TPA: mechanosensitive ion channel [Desulfurella acetivorans]|nr:mechanosensitive ion channel [Desulfurella acetivorans]